MVHDLYRPDACLYSAKREDLAWGRYYSSFSDRAKWALLSAVDNWYHSTHSSTLRQQNISKSKMKRITLKKTFDMWSFCCFSSLTQLWLCYLVYKHEKERNALKLMHISLHLKESCVNGCIDEVLWGLKAFAPSLNLWTCKKKKKKVRSSQPENGLFFLFSKSCIPVNVPALNGVICVCESRLTRAGCSHTLRSQYVTVWMGMNVSA